MISALTLFQLSLVFVCFCYSFPVNKPGLLMERKALWRIFDGCILKIHACVQYKKREEKKNIDFSLLRRSIQIWVNPEILSSFSRAEEMVFSQSCFDARQIFASLTFRTWRTSPATHTPTTTSTRLLPILVDNPAPSSNLLHYVISSHLSS